MAEKLCALRKKGGGGQKYTETSLWTNSAPSSSFAAQTVALSESIDNFKYIKIHYAQSISNTSTTYDAIYLVSDVKKSIIGGSAENNLVSFAIESSANNKQVRFINYISSTSLGITTAERASGTGNSDGSAPPLEILGLNELSTEPVIMKKIGEISLPAGTATVTGNLSENISDYKNLLVSMVEYNGSSIPLTGIGSTILGLFTTNYFASNNPVGYYGIGNQGSMSYYSITMQKMSDTSIKFTRSNTTGARTAYVYGIK